MVKVLLTGAFGNLGTSTIIELAEQGYEIRCLATDSKRCKKRIKIYKKKYDFEVSYGNLADRKSIAEAMKNIDVIIHTAAILTAVCNKDPDLAKKVNIEGTRNLIDEARNNGIKQLIFASSVSVHGLHYPSMPPIKTTDPFKPHDTYNYTKVKCEEIIKNSEITWTIIRFGAILPVETRGEQQAKLDDYNLEMTFGIPLEQKIEIIHSRDAALALVNAIGNNKAYNNVFFGGGGPNCQMYEREFIFDMLKLIGISNVPDNVFKKPLSDTCEDGWFYTHWMDTVKSQEVLQYQRKTFEDYKKDMLKPPLIQRIIFIIFSPFIKRYLILKSPYRH